MHWVTHLTLLALTAANTYLIFYRDWDPMDAWRLCRNSGAEAANDR